MCACGKSSLVLSVSGFFLILDTTHPVPLNNKKVEEEFALTVHYCTVTVTPTDSGTNCLTGGYYFKINCIMYM
jgi:hypothetical protein